MAGDQEKLSRNSNFALVRIEKTNIVKLSFITHNPTHFNKFLYVQLYKFNFLDCIQDMVNLNLTDSGSDTDNNEDEETDPEFVFVDKPLVHSVKRAQRG